mgnify:CR=1 FL=1
MTQTDVTARFGLPLLAVAQGQKEITHNEALTLLDALVHAAVEGEALAAPPPAPANGTCWLVATGASGEWAGQNDMIAIRCEGGCRFAPPRAGMRIVRPSDGAWLRFDAAARQWVVPGAIPIPQGGGVVDVEARSAIAALLPLLAAQGLLVWA